MDALEPLALRLVDSGDARAAAESVVRGYGPSVYGHLGRLLDPDDALDVFQQWAEDVWRGLPGFRRECRLRTWSYRLAQHAASRFLRDPYRARRERLPSGAASQLAASVAHTSAMATDARRDQLRKLAATLPQEDRALMSLRADRELSWDECSEILAGEGADVSPVALRKRWERLKDRLGRMARDAGLLD